MTGTPVLDAAMTRRHSSPPLFASSRCEPRARRPTDVVLAAVSLVALLFTSVLSKIGGDLDADLGALLARFPPFLDPAWLALVWAPVAWATVLLGAALVRRRPALARDVVAGVVIALVLAVLVAALANGDGWAPLRRTLDLDGLPSFPPGLLTIAAGAIAVTAPHVTRPFRHLGRWLVAGQALGATMLGASLVSGSVAAILIGLLAAAAVHLAVGSPGGRPTTSRIGLALHDLGLDVVTLTPAAMQTTGVVRFTGTDRRARSTSRSTAATPGTPSC